MKSNVYIVNFPGVPLRIERAIKVAALRTWAWFDLPYPETFWIVMAHYMTEPDGSKSDTVGSYHADADVVHLATDAFFKDGDDPAIRAAIFTAHEITHKAQWARGDVVPPSHRNWRYDDCPFEIEAIQMSANIAREMFPRKMSSMSTGEKGSPEERFYYPQSRAMAKRSLAA